MPTERKSGKIKDLQDMLGGSGLAILTEYRGMTVSELTNLRRSLRPKGTEYHITKNTLLRIAAKELGYSGLDEVLAGPTAVAFIKDDLAGGSKAVLDFARTNKAIVIKQAILNGQLVDEKRLEAITKLETKEVMVSKMLGSLLSPPRNMVNVLSQPTRNLVTVLSEYQKKLEAEGQPAA